MTDSMNFGPDWIRNLSSEGTTAGGAGGGNRYQLADYRYGREEMLALFDKTLRPPISLASFKPLFSEQTLLPLALTPNAEEEQRGWQPRPNSLSGPPRGRGNPIERGGRVSRGGRGGYQTYGRPAPPYDAGWGNGEQPEWSPRKEYISRGGGNDNWRRMRANEDDDGWRNTNLGRIHDKWGRSMSWRGEGDSEERSGPPEKGNRTSWQEGNRIPPSRRSWENEDHLPEWAMENPIESGGTFDSSGAFHGSDDEQLENKPYTKREAVLQKSTSQQHITNKGHPPSLQTSKSVMSLSRPQESIINKIKDKNYETSEKSHSKLQENGTIEKENMSQIVPENIDKEQPVREKRKTEGPPKLHKMLHATSNGPVTNPSAINKDEEEFERLQEDLVLKLVVDEDLPKPNVAPVATDNSNIQPPPNLGPPMQEQWFYQDPQGQMQGPFPSVEMADWYKAGYFNNQLKVRRPCDEKFYLLGELVSHCDGANPFQTNVRFPALKADLLQFQYLMALKQAQAGFGMAEPWNSLTLQQQEVAAQRLIMHPQVPPELPFIHQANTSNPLMHMISQMQQAHKLPPPNLGEKPPTSVPNQLDPIMVQMSNLHQLQSRIPTAGLPNHMTAGLPAGFSAEGLNMPGTLGNHPLAGMAGGGIPANLASALNLPRPPTHPPVESLTPKPDNDPISSLLKQLQQQKQHQQQQQQQSLDSLWQHNQYPVPSAMPPPQWQSQDIAMSMWDVAKSNESSIPVPAAAEPKPEVSGTPIEKQPQAREPEKKDDCSAKELRKKKEVEEKEAKREAFEKRKQEQRKQELEKKAAEEKKKKEEERIKKEIEKVKKEAEEKRLKELEEKRKLKELRRAEEEAKKKQEEQKKTEDERIKRETKEREENAKKEATRLTQEQAARAAKIAPWCQSGSAQGLSMSEIQKLEKEKRAQDALIQQQRQQIHEQLQQQQQQILQQERIGGIQLNWANKPAEPRKVKSLAEIQAEEQERLVKQVAEARLLALQKEKEIPPVQTTGNIWNSQNLSWNSTSNMSQWSSSNSGGFWDEPSPNKPSNKPSTISKNSSTTTVFSATAAGKQQQPQAQKIKTKVKKEEVISSKNNNNGTTSDDFTSWCYRTLSNISSEVDVPTFITFLRDIESALEVRDYCKDYLGDNPQAHQFASNFLEKRRSFKPKSNAHKDDMCSPAPALTPSMQHNSEFQEVKGKNKKNKKNKMLKVDSRILGFNVTSAPDRINVGDRDYGDNS